MTAKASIVIPVYNTAKWLRQCLDSALGQTLRNIEVICIDDGSTDESVKILAEYRGRDGRVHVLSQTNSGQAVARNRGIAAAHGKYIAFLDSDDLYPDSGALADLVAAAEKNDADVCGGSLEELLPNGAIVSAFGGADSAFVFRHEGRIDFRDYAYDFGFYRFIYRTDFLRRSKIAFPDYRRFQDPPFMVKALAAAGTFYAIKRPTYRYRVELKTVNWHENDMVKAKGLLRGLTDVARQADVLGLPKLSGTVLYQACEQFADVLLDSAITETCKDDVASLCRAFRVPDIDSLLGLPYPGRTPLVLRRAKRVFRRRFRALFRLCRFASDVFRHGMPYAAGRFKGDTL